MHLFSVWFSQVSALYVHLLSLHAGCPVDFLQFIAAKSVDVPESLVSLSLQVMLCRINLVCWFTKQELQYMEITVIVLGTGHYAEARLDKCSMHNLVIQSLHFASSSPCGHLRTCVCIFSWQSIHPRLQRAHVDARLAQVADSSTSKVDWATAESMAMGSLLLQGVWCLAAGFLCIIIIVFIFTALRSHLCLQILIPLVLN